MLLHAHDRIQAAEVCYFRAHRLDNRDPRWAYYLAAARSANGRYEQAVEAYRAAVALRPDYAPAQLGLVKALAGAGELDAAREACERVIARHPQLAAAHYELGKIHASQGRLKEALESHAAACRIYPRYGAARYALATAYRRLGRSAEAAEHFEIYEQNKSAVPPAEDPLLAAVHALGGGGVTHIAEGQRLAAAGKLEAAVQAHLKALEIDPRLLSAHVNLISLYGRLGRNADALTHYRAAIEIDPGSDEAHYNYGVLAASQGRAKEAAAAYRKVLAANPRHPEAHNNLGYLLQQAGRPGEAAAHFRSALEYQPGYAQAHFNLGMLLMERKDYRAAIGHFRASLDAADESQARRLFALAAAYARSGDRENALLYARQARQAASQSGQRELLAGIEKNLAILERAR
jgi:tetratricopeptide (TPR) repeat protein